MSFGEQTLTTLKLNEDMHVHSTFSDGRDSLIRNLDFASRRGLCKMGCVEHVWKTSKWIPEFVDSVKKLDETSSVKLLPCVEAKMLNVYGELDIPSNLNGIDYIYVADHQLPIKNRLYSPLAAKELLQSKKVSSLQIISALINAIIKAVESNPNVVVAHLFSILPKIGISEQIVPPLWIATLASSMKKHGAILEVDERWRCPSLGTVQIFVNAGVKVVASSDAHKSEDIAIYRYNLEMAIALNAS